MSQDKVTFTLDGRELTAEPGETIWQAAHRNGIDIPHLCYAHEPGYRADGNCRACMVEIEGERVLQPSCVRQPKQGMVVHKDNERAQRARDLVMELLVSDQPPKKQAHDVNSLFWRWADQMGVTQSRFPSKERQPQADLSHKSMSVNLDACIHCNLCVRACREVQANDVIGMAYRGADSKIVFDFDDPMGDSTCVACGECVQACPTGALMPASVMDANQVGDTDVDKKVDSVCPYCGVGCQLTYHVKNDKIQYVAGKDGPSNRKRLCVKGRFGFDYIDHEDRLTEPLIRREDAPKHADTEIDPANPYTHFRKATWEEAMAKAAEGLRTIRDREGRYGLAGFGSAKGTNEEAYLFQKLVRVGFGSNNVDHCTRLCHASSVAALIEGIGSGGVTASFREAEKSDVIIVIGANPTENHPVAATFFKQARRRGAEVIVIDPRGQAMRKFATHMIREKPGTDVALLNSMMYTILEEGLYDEQYIQARTDGWEAQREHLKGFSPERMASVTGVDAETIRTIARKYAQGERSIVFWGMGISQHVHGTDNSRCLIALALMTGQTGREGTGLHPLRGQNNVQGASDAGLIPMVFPDYKKTTDEKWRRFLEEMWGAHLDDKPGLTVTEIMDNIHENVIKGMYIMGENPAMSDPDAEHAREGLAKLEHLVVQDLFMTETAFHADVVLPASAWPEKRGTVINTNRQVQMGRPALPLPGNARQDLELIEELAQRLGLDWDYGGPKAVYEEMYQVMPMLKNITWERVENEDSVTYPCPSPDHPGESIVFSESFPTETGRAKFVPADVTAPDEVPDVDYPLLLNTGRQLEHWHTGAMTRRSKRLDDIEPEPTVCLHPSELRRIDAAPGEMLLVETRRGRIQLRARADRAVSPGQLFIPFAFKEAAANLLTNPAIDPYGKIPEYKVCAARIDKVSDTAPAEAAE